MGRFGKYEIDVFFEDGADKDKVEAFWKELDASQDIGASHIEPDKDYFEIHSERTQNLEWRGDNLKALLRKHKDIVTSIQADMYVESEGDLWWDKHEDDEDE